MNLFKSLLLLTGAILGIAIGVVVAQQNKPVLIQYGEWQINTSLWVLALSFLLAFIGLSLLVRVVYAIPSVNRSISGWWRSKRKNHAHQQITRAVIEDTNGNRIKAIRLLQDGSESSDEPVPLLLYAASLAEQIGEYEFATELRQKSARILGEEASEFGKYLKLKSGQNSTSNAETRRALERLLEETPNCAPALFDLIQLYLEDKEGGRALDYIDVLEKLDYLAPEKIQQMRVTCWLQFLEHTAADTQSKLWSSIPKSIREDTRLLFARCKVLIENHQHKEAYQLLSKALRRKFQPELLACFVELDFDANARIEILDNLYREQGEDRDLLLAIARLHGKAGNLNTARLYLNRVPKTARGVDVQNAHLELELLELTHEASA